MKNLKDYERKTERLVTTSVTLTPDQMAFVRARNINLSTFVRDKLQDFINAVDVPHKKGGSK